MEASSAHLEGRLVHPQTEKGQRGPVSAPWAAFANACAQVMRRTVLSLFLVGCGTTPVHNPDLPPVRKPSDAPQSNREAMQLWVRMLTERGVPQEVIDERWPAILHSLNQPQMQYQSNFVICIPPLVCIEPSQLMMLSRDYCIRWWDYSPETVQTYLVLIHSLKPDSRLREPSRFQNFVRLHQYMDDATTRKGPYAIGLADDPCTDLMLDIMESHPQMHLEDVICVARALRATNKTTASSADIRSTLALINQTRRSYDQEVLLDQGTSTSIISHQEMMDIMIPTKRFGTDIFFRRLQQVTGRDPQEFPAPRPGLEGQARRTEFEQFKQRVLKHIVDAPPGHRFFFDGHGSRDAFWFSDGENASATAAANDAPYCLKVEDVLLALQMRAIQHTLMGNAEELGQDVFWFAMCRAGDFVDQIRRGMEGWNYTPRLVASSETIRDASPNSELTDRKGFYSYSNFSRRTGNTYFGDLMNLEGNQPRRVLFGDVIRRDRAGRADTSIMMLVPYPYQRAVEQRPTPLRPAETSPPQYLQISSRPQEPEDLPEQRRINALRPSERLGIIRDSESEPA